MSSVGEQKVQDGSLKRELGERHIRLMALGACIGVGLFLVVNALLAIDWMWFGT